MSSAATLRRADRPAAVLFDLDGTLIDVRRSYDEAIYRTVTDFAARRRPLSRAWVLRVKHRPDANDDIDATLMVLARLGCRPSRDDVERRFDEHYLGTNGAPGLIVHERWFVPVRALRDLARRIPLGVVTGRNRRDVRLAFEAAGASGMFGVVVTIDDVRPKKPDPTPVRAALDALAVRRAWYVGDAPADVLAARAAGVLSVAVLGPEATRGRRRVLSRYHPDVIVRSARDVVAALR